MPDNFQINASTAPGGPTIRLINRSGILSQAILIDLNTGGVETLLQGVMPIGGLVAAGIADAGNPVKIGGVGVILGADPAAIAAGQRANLLTNLHGIPYFQPGHPNSKCLRAFFTAAQTDTPLLLVAGGSKAVCTRARVALSNSVSGVDVSYIIGFGLTTTPTTTGAFLSHGGRAGSDPDSEGNGAGMLGIGADGEDIRFTCSNPASGSIEVNLTYYLQPA